MRILDIIFAAKKKYVKSPIDGKVLSITCDSLRVENKTIRIHRPLVELGQVVKKGDNVGYRI